MIFLSALQLQNALGNSTRESGAARLPIHVRMLLFSPVAGGLGERIGPRVPVTVGALTASGGMLLLGRVQPGSGYPTAVLPAISVFGLGLAALVAPLTAAVLDPVPKGQTGVASGVNNVAARLAGPLAIVLLPLTAGMGGPEDLGSLEFSESPPPRPTTTCHDGPHSPDAQ